LSQDYHLHITLPIAKDRTEDRRAIIYAFARQNQGMPDSPVPDWLKTGRVEQQPTSAEKLIETDDSQ